MTTVNKVVDSGIITTSLLLTLGFEELTFLSISTVRTIQWTKTTPPHLELYALLFTAHTYTLVFVVSFTSMKPDLTKYKTKENNNCTKNEIELRHIYTQKTIVRKIDTRGSLFISLFMFH